MKELSRFELHERSILTLGLDPEACDLTFIEAIAAALRRVAGFLCPCTSHTLIQAVMGSLEGIVEDPSEVREAIEDTLQAILAYGDLLEEFEVSVVAQPNRGLLIYAAPPAFLWRESGSVLIIGIVPDQRSPLPSHLERRLQYAGHTRRLVPEENESLRTDLKQLGLIELSMEAWNKKAPVFESFRSHIERFDNLLRPNPGTLTGLKLLNSAKPVIYYPARWEDLSGQTGRFVARRPRPYGNDLWCYVDVRNGQPEGLVDMPTLKSPLRGCDEAWRLQAAIDAARGQPQQYRVRTSTDQNTRVVDFFSPVPLWAQRRWDVIGEPVSRSACLFSYKFSAGELQQELKFIQEHLWLKAAPQ